MFLRTTINLGLADLDAGALRLSAPHALTQDIARWLHDLHDGDRTSSMGCSSSPATVTGSRYGPSSSAGTDGEVSAHVVGAEAGPLSDRSHPDLVEAFRLLRLTWAESRLIGIDPRRRCDWTATLEGSMQPSGGRASVVYDVIIGGCERAPMRCSAATREPLQLVQAVRARHAARTTAWSPCNDGAVSAFVSGRAQRTSLRLDNVVGVALQRTAANRRRQRDALAVVSEVPLSWTQRR